jgi:hypothetical protein
MTERIQKSDLNPYLARHTGNKTFAQALQQITNGSDLLRVLGRYIHFNSTFGGGVANLAGEIAVRQNLFRDPEETVEILADRSMDVASDIFAAAVDEFDDRATPHRDTHRSLAQATLKATGAFLGYDTISLNAAVRPNEATLTAIRKMREGYGVNMPVEESKLFRALGFHLGSEILADEEFRLLDSYLQTHHPALVAALQQATVEVSGAQHAAYYWIYIHTSVEADHFEFAVKAANNALRYYAGTESLSRVKGWIVAGFAEFGEMQQEFMTSLMEA